MSLSRTIKGMVCATLAFTAATLSPQYASAEEVTLRLASVAPEKSIWMKMLNDYADRVNKLTNGEVKIEIFPGGQLGTMEDTLSQMLRGRVDIWTGATPAMSALEPSLNMLLMPYLFDNDEEVACTYSKLFDETSDLLAGSGQFLGFVPVGWHNISSKEKIAVPADIKNQKARNNASEISVALFEAYGANPVPMSPTEGASAFSTGLVTTGDSSLVFWFAAGVAKAAPYLLKVHHYYNSSGMIIGSRSWSKLTESQKKAMLDARDVLAYGNLVKQIEGFEAKISAMAVESGATITEVSPEERDEWIRLGQSTWDRILAKYGEGASTYFDLIRAKKAECNG